MTVGFLYGAGAETLIFVTGTSGKHPKLFVSRQKDQSQLWIPRKPRKIGIWVSGAEIQTSAVDTRTAVWVSTPEKFSKIVLGETRNFLESLGGSQRQLCIKTWPLQHVRICEGPLKNLVMNFPLRFLQFGCAESWGFGAEVFAEVFLL